MTFYAPLYRDEGPISILLSCLPKYCGRLHSATSAWDSLKLRLPGLPNARAFSAKILAVIIQNTGLLCMPTLDAFETWDSIVQQ